MIVDGEPKAYPLDVLRSTDGSIHDKIGTSDIEIDFTPETDFVQVRVRGSDMPLPSVRAYWFAWQAFYPETLLYSNEESEG